MILKYIVSRLDVYANHFYVAFLPVWQSWASKIGLHLKQPQPVQFQPGLFIPQQPPSSPPQLGPRCLPWDDSRCQETWAFRVEGRSIKYLLFFATYQAFSSCLSCPPGCQASPIEHSLPSELCLMIREKLVLKCFSVYGYGHLRWVFSTGLGITQDQALFCAVVFGDEPTSSNHSGEKFSLFWFFAWACIIFGTLSVDGYLIPLDWTKECVHNWRQSDSHG